VTRSQREVRGLLANLLVFLARQVDVLKALRIGTFTENLQVASGLLAWVGQPSVRLPDPLVDLPKKGFVRRKLVVPVQGMEISGRRWVFLEGRLFDDGAAGTGLLDNAVAVELVHD
jgi:hypothetical protein